MTTQTEAQRILAQWQKCESRIAELEAANAELVEALKAEMDSAWDCVSYHPKMHAAIAKHGGAA